MRVYDRIDGSPPDIPKAEDDLKPQPVFHLSAENLCVACEAVSLGWPGPSDR